MIREQIKTAFACAFALVLGSAAASFASYNPGTSSLASVLSSGNTTGASDIVVTSGQKITAPASADLLLGANSATKVKIDQNGNVISNASGSTIAQNATNGFLYVPVCATGAPSGTPTSVTGGSPVTVGGDNNFYAYMGGAWVRVNTAASGTPTLSQVIAAGNTTGGGGVLLQISSGDSINFLSGAGTSTANSIRFPTGIWIGGDGSNNLVLQAGGNIKLGTGSGTGSGSAALGANCPATTVSAPFTWLTLIGPAGDTLRVPAWK